jgi:hypothetical protein
MYSSVPPSLANNYLVLDVPLPFEYETDGTPGMSLLGVAISVTPSLVAKLLMQLENPGPTKGVNVCKPSERSGGGF